jgi:opacity protein-like surface antigen
MKRHFFLILTAFAFWIAAQSVQAQTSTPVILGVKGGVSLGNVSLSPDLNTLFSKSNRSGILAGGYAELGIVDGLYITGEVLYAQMGFKYSVPNSVIAAIASAYGLSISGTADVTRKADYIHVPISLKYEFPIPESIVRPYVFGGPSISFNVSSKQVVELSGQLTQYAQYAQLLGYPLESDLKDSTNFVNVAGHLGVGVEFQVSSNVLLFVDGRYSMSFTNATKEAGQEAKPRNIMIMGGVGLRLP